MQVQIRALLAVVVGAAGLWLSASVADAAEGCTNCAPPPPPTSPPVPPYTGCAGGGCLPPPPPKGGGCYGGGCAPPAPPVACCGGGNLNVNVNINNVSASASASADAASTAIARAYGSARAGSASTVIVAGGGGAYFNVDQPYPMTAQGLAVEGSISERVRVPFTSTRSWEKRYRIQAVCLDDRGVPHPASQVRPGKSVADNYNDELYRCIAGSRLQWTRTDADGGVGETFTCNKNEALWYGGKVLECRPQKRERDCNERSLLRRYGAGEKELVMRGEETYTEYREEIVERSLATSGSMMMDGGVGGRVF